MDHINNKIIKIHGATSGSAPWYDSLVIFSYKNSTVAHLSDIWTHLHKMSIWSNIIITSHSVLHLTHRGRSGVLLNTLGNFTYVFYFFLNNTSRERAILIRSLNKYSLMFREIQTTLQINKLLKKYVSADLWTKIARSRLNVISHSIQSTE